MSRSLPCSTVLRQVRPNLAFLFPVLPAPVRASIPLLCGLVLLAFSWLWAPYLPAQNAEPVGPRRITGVVTDSETGDALPGVLVRVQQHSAAAYTNTNGRYALPRPAGGPLKLAFSMTGYTDLVVNLGAQQSELDVKLEAEPIQYDDVVISASRVTESLMKSPVTVEKLDILKVRETPSLNAYDALSTMKGVDLQTSSITFRVLNSRAFNNPTNTRMVQRIDGIDMQAPGLNFPVGALTGASDLDIKSVELLAGAASALYGPNAFNGLINIYTRDPFEYPGLSASARFAVNHLDGVDHEPAPLADLAVRWADTVGSKFGYKLNLGYLRGTDWHATNRVDIADYTGLTNNPTNSAFMRGPGNPGYDGMNLYGDEVSQVVDVPLSLFNTDSTAPYRIARTGYAEPAVGDYDAYSFRGDLGLYYKVNSDLQLILNSRFAMGTTMYQSGTRLAISDFMYHVHKVEAKSDRFFVRAYAAFEDAGNTYDTFFKSVFLNEVAKPSANQWFPQYIGAFSPAFNPLLNDALSATGRDTLRPLNDADARRYADSDNRALYDYFLDNYAGLAGVLGYDSPEEFASAFTGGEARYEPGSPRFEQVSDSIRQIPIGQGGAAFIDKTALYHLEGQYDFSEEVNWVEIVAGGSFRLFDLNSDGTIFTDTLQVDPETGETTRNSLNVWEWGAYVQFTKRLLGERIRLSFSGRVDQTKNFEPQFSPRLAGVFTLGRKRNHNLRASFQTAFRMPTLQGQYIDLNTGLFRYTGGLRELDFFYGLVLDDPNEGLVQNTYTLQSVQAYRQALAEGVDDPSLLQRYQAEEIQPERVFAYELGYKARLFDRLVLDLAGYYNRYENFIETISIVGPDPNDSGADGQLALTPEDIANENSFRYDRYGNLSDILNLVGASVGVNYALTNQYILTANYTFTKLLDITEEQRRNTSFNTPEHKVNVGFTGRNVWRGLGFGLNYRWSDEYFFVSGFTNNNPNAFVPAIHTLDAQLSYAVPQWKTTFKLGGTNITNNRYFDIFGGPTIGAMVYVQVTYDQFMR